jgi:hypothetical protein
MSRPSERSNGTQTQALTEDELRALDMTGELANLCRRVIGQGPNADHDWNEIAQRIHAIQHTLMAQAAARCYPDRFRVLGGVVGD